MNSTKIQLATSICTAAVVVFTISASHAQPGDGSPGQVDSPGVQLDVQAPGSAADLQATSPSAAVDEQAGADQMWISPTAINQPKGIVSIHSYEIFVAGITYGITDRIQLSVDAMVPGLLGDTNGPFVLARAKGQIYDGQMVKVAVHGVAGTVEYNAMGTAGIATTLCITHDCSWLVNGNLMSVWFGESGDLGRGTFISAGICAGLTQNIKIMAESIIDVPNEENEDALESMSTWYGARFSNRRGAVDVGVMQTVTAHSNTVMLVPWLNATLRVN